MIAKFFKIINLMGILYIFSFLYSSVLGYYPLMFLYHLRGGMEWVSFFIPLAVQWFIISTLIIIFIIQKLKKYI